eukprot:jgi/Bigna1/75960/fgenesh1_pg.38_\
MSGDPAVTVKEDGIDGEGNVNTKDAEKVEAGKEKDDVQSFLTTTPVPFHWKSPEMKKQMARRLKEIKEQLRIKQRKLQSYAERQEYRLAAETKDELNLLKAEASELAQNLTSLPGLNIPRPPPPQPPYRRQERRSGGGEEGGKDTFSSMINHEILDKLGPSEILRLGDMKEAWKKQRQERENDGETAPAAAPTLPPAPLSKEKAAAVKAASNPSKKNDITTSENINEAPHRSSRKQIASLPLRGSSEHPMRQLLKRGMRVMYNSPSAGKFIDAIVRADGKVDLNIRADADPKRIKLIQGYTKDSNTARRTSSMNIDELMEVFPPEPEGRNLAEEESGRIIV